MIMAMTHHGMTVSSLRARSGCSCHLEDSVAPSVCSLALEPAAAQPDRTLSHRAEPEPPRLPDPAAGGAARPTHTYTCTLIEEKTAPWRQHHPQQVSSEHYC